MQIFSHESCLSLFFFRIKALTCGLDHMLTSCKLAFYFGVSNRLKLGYTDKTHKKFEGMNLLLRGCEGVIKMDNFLRSAVKFDALSRTKSWNCLPPGFISQH